MPSHFLLSAEARLLSLASVLRMTDVHAERTFASVRWPETDGKAVCPSCGCSIGHKFRCPNGALHFRCKTRRTDFSLTSGTLCAFQKLPLQTYLATTVVFCTEAGGKSALALSSDLDVQYKTTFVVAHKMREAMPTEVKAYKLGGEGRTVEVDRTYSSRYVKPANHKENCRDRCLVEKQNGKRQVVVVAREHDGLVLPSVFITEGSALACIRNHVAAGTKLHAN